MLIVTAQAAQSQIKPPQGPDLGLCFQGPCHVLRQRVPYKLQLSPSKARAYCKKKYGQEAITVNRLAITFCATPDRTNDA
jgi:hypothetical protein